jgi:hypothetical protein
MILLDVAPYKIIQAKYLPTPGFLELDNEDDCRLLVNFDF